MVVNKKIMEKLATELFNKKEKIILIYAFNGSGKTRLSVAYKNITKEKNNGKHSGVYYNAYSEDLFIWNNDEENDGSNIRLTVKKSSLNEYHSLLAEEKLREKLSLYKTKFDFKFNLHSNIDEGIESIQFYLKNNEFANENEVDRKTKIKTENSIKISRGEEHIFIWCFFLAMFDIEGWTGEGKQSDHFFIDDPVSSLDDHNIFVTASTVMDLIDVNYTNRKIIITTHHFGFISILADWLKKGEHNKRFENKFDLLILKKYDSEIKFVNTKNEVLLYHLELMQIIRKAIKDNKLYAYHFAILRQILENLSSFLGAGRFSYVLEQIGLNNSEEISRIINILTHKNVFRYEPKILVPDNEKLFKEIFEGIQNKYNFVLH